MNYLKQQSKKSLVWLALLSLATSGLFSIVGAPFLRAFFVSARSVAFWTTAAIFVATLFLLGSANYKISETAVYVGAIWMTLGIYSELEKRGVSWKVAGLASLASGFLFSVAGYFLVLRNMDGAQTVAEMTAPLREAMIKAYPDNDPSDFNVEGYLPGIVTASLFVALAVGIIFEPKISRLFKLKREFVASGIRWLEFRLPDIAIWVTLFSILFVLRISFLTLPPEGIAISGNILLASAVMFFFQGLAVAEFCLRYFRVGSFTRAVTYILIFLQFSPFVILLGFVDYWADFRRRIRKKQNQTN